MVSEASCRDPPATHIGCGLGQSDEARFWLTSFFLPNRNPAVYVSPAGRATRGDNGTRSIPKVFDGAAAGPLRLPSHTSRGRKMVWSRRENTRATIGTQGLPPLPRVLDWLLLGVATIDCGNDTRSLCIRNLPKNRCSYLFVICSRQFHQLI